MSPNICYISLYFCLKYFIDKITNYNSFFLDVKSQWFNKDHLFPHSAIHSFIHSASKWDVQSGGPTGRWGTKPQVCPRRERSDTLRTPQYVSVDFKRHLITSRDISWWTYRLRDWLQCSTTALPLVLCHLILKRSQLMFMEFAHDFVPG